MTNMPVHEGLIDQLRRAHTAEQPPAAFKAEISAWLDRPHVEALMPVTASVATSPPRSWRDRTGAMMASAAAVCFALVIWRGLEHRSGATATELQGRFVRGTLTVNRIPPCRAQWQVQTAGGGALDRVWVDYAEGCVLPDTLTVESEEPVWVIAKGRFDDRGQFHAKEVLAQPRPRWRSQAAELRDGL
jgi:hypothetical protein